MAQPVLPLHSHLVQGPLQRVVEPPTPLVPPGAVVRIDLEEFGEVGQKASQQIGEHFKSFWGGTWHCHKSHIEGGGGRRGEGRGRKEGGGKGKGKGGGRGKRREEEEKGGRRGREGRRGGEKGGRDWRALQELMGRHLALPHESLIEGRERRGAWRGRSFLHSYPEKEHIAAALFLCSFPRLCLFKLSLGTVLEQGGAM